MPGDRLDDDGAQQRQELLTAGLRCYYADEAHSHLRPHCQHVGTVAYGHIVLCATCDAMHSAGRNVPRRLPGAELTELLACARDLAAALEGLDSGVAAARRAGASWGQVGAALGISRQAAQQRFG